MIKLLSILKEIRLVPNLKNEAIEEGKKLILATLDPFDPDFNPREYESTTYHYLDREVPIIRQYFNYISGPRDEDNNNIQLWIKIGNHKFVFYEYDNEIVFEIMDDHKFER